MALTLPWTSSKVLDERSRFTIPGGVNSNVRLKAPRVFFERAAGAWLWDVDGNAYVDYVLGQGPSFLGHACDEVNRAVAEACTRGMLFGSQHRGEIEAAEAVIAGLGWPEMVRLGMTGTECVQAALRLARAATGRDRFVRFEGHYHGWMDNVLLAIEDGAPALASRGQWPEALAESFVLPWNDLARVEALFAESGDRIAAVIMEPVMFNAGAVEPVDGYLTGVRSLCDKYGVVLIFDEVITGFRISRSGAVGRYGVQPDLATYGKAMAGGWPVAALAGSAELMELFGDGAVNHSGTFNGSVMATAAVIATQRLLDEDPPYERIEAYGTELITGLTKLGAAHDQPIRASGLPGAFHLRLESPPPATPTGAQIDADRYAAFARVLASNGVWVTSRGTWYVSAAHGSEELQVTLEGVDAALAEFCP